MENGFSAADCCPVSCCGAFWLLLTAAALNSAGFMEKGTETEKISTLMNYAYLLQTIIPGSPWRRRTTSATQTTSMPVRSWVLFVGFSAALLISAASEAYFFLTGSTFITLEAEVSHNFSLIRAQPSLFLFFLLCSSHWRLRLAMNHDAISKMAAAPSARRDLCVIFS